MPGKDGEKVDVQTVIEGLNLLEGAIESRVIKGLPAGFDIKDLKVGGKYQLELRDIKGARLDRANGGYDMNDQRWHGGGSGGGGGTPASPSTSIQFNNAGSFGGSSDLTFDGNDVLIGNITNGVQIQKGGGIQLFSSGVPNVQISNDGEAFFSDSVQTPKVESFGVLEITTIDSDDIHIFPGADFGAGGGDTLIEGGAGILTVIEIGGQMTVKGGLGVGSGAGGDATVRGGEGGDISGKGGDASLVGGNAIGGDNNGGDVYLNPGYFAGTGIVGRVKIQDPASGLNSILDTDSIATADRTFSFPDQSGVFSTVTSGVAAPGSTPAALGQVYIDTMGAKVYCSTGITSSADWKILN